MSGILQQGYSLGYVLAACANLGVGGATDSWKTVFWAAGKKSIDGCSKLVLMYSSSGYLHRRRHYSNLLPGVKTIPRG